MKKIIFNLIIGISLISLAKGQMGIQTKTPQADLHVNGNLQLSSDLQVGGTANTKGNPGQDGQVLTSNGDGNAPGWKSLEVISDLPLIAMIANRTATSAYLIAGIPTTISFDGFPKNMTNLVAYNSPTNEFYILKAGYYKVNARLSYDMSTNAAGNTAGGARTTVWKNGSTLFSSHYTTHGEVTSAVNHTLVGTGYFEFGDRITITGLYTQRYRLQASNLTITYVK